MHWNCVVVNAMEACGQPMASSPTPGPEAAPPICSTLGLWPPHQAPPSPPDPPPPLSPHTGHYCLLRGYPQLMQANSIQLTRCLCLCFFSKGGKVLLKYICVLVIQELNCRSSGVSSKGPPSHLQPQCSITWRRLKIKTYKIVEFKF